MPPTMEFVQSFQSALDAIATNGHELLQHFDHGHGEPARSADRPGASSQLPRKKLIEAATKLMQLAIRPEEYLDKLANNVGFLCIKVANLFANRYGIVPGTELRALAR